MGVLTDFLVADEIDAAKVGQSFTPLEEWAGIEGKGIEHVKLGRLWALVSGATYQSSFIREFSQLHEQSEDGPWVFRVPGKLVVAIAGLDDCRGSEISREWAKVEEFALDRWDAASVEKFLSEFRVLAQQACAQNKSLLMWMSL